VAPRPALPSPPRPAHTRKQFLLVAGLLILAAVGLALTTRTLSVGQSTTFSGEVQAAGQLPVNFTTAGRIAEIRVRIGDRVKAGDVLATQDRTVAKQALAAAQAALRADEAQLASLASSTSQATMLELDADRARAQLLAAQAAAATASTSAAQEAAQQRVAAAELALDLARRKLEEETRGGDPARRSAIEAAIRRDKAAVALAKATLRDKLLLAPVAGVVLDIGATPGVFADSAGVRTYPDADPVTEPSKGFSFLPSAPDAQASRPNNGNGFAPPIILGDDSRWRVKAQVPESEIVGLRTGQAVDITFPALPGTRIPATLTTRGMAPIFVGNEVHYPAIFELESAPDDMLPGMTATVHVR
jgi:multidrug efflux pump subunit AcrA (membrane-fusion protein)